MHVDVQCICTKDLVRRESVEMKAQRESQSQVVALEREVSMLKQQLADAKADRRIDFSDFLKEEFL